MTDQNSSFLGLPFIAPAQAQKHITHNEALQILDATVQLSVVSVENNPPSDPDGSTHLIIGPSPLGIFDSHENDLAVFQDGAWVFLSPKQGWRAYDISLGALRIFDGNEWVVFMSQDGQSSTGSDLSNLTELGINAAPDSHNRLSLNAPASLFNHEGGSHRITINKNSAQETASLLLQAQFSGHAEVGLTGDNNYHIRVSPNGTDFRDGMIIDAESGIVDFPSGLHSNLMTSSVNATGGRTTFTACPILFPP